MTRNTGSGASHDAAWLRLYAVVAALPLVLTACGGGGGGGDSPAPTPPAPAPAPTPASSITITPSATTAQAPGGAAVTLNSVVTGSTVTPTWTLSGPGSLSATSGTVIMYTPPATQDFDATAPVIVSASVPGLTTQSVTLGLATTVPGLSWANVSATSVGTLQSVDFAGGRYVAVSDAGNALVSTDAATWTATPVLTSGTATDHLNARAVTHFGNVFVAAGSRSAAPYTSTTGAAAYSADGLTWTMASATAFNGAIRGLFTNGKLFGVGDGGNIYTSADGQSWSFVASLGSSVTLNGGAFGNPSGTNTYVAVGNAGFVAASFNGVQWGGGALPNLTENLRAVAWTGSKFVAVGDNATIITSPDGIAWNQKPTSAIPGSLRSVAVSSTGEVVVVGDSGIETSPDGTTWTKRDPAGTSALFDVSWVNNQFVAVGAGSAIKTSSH